MELLAKISWPLLALIFLLVFREPIVKKINESSQISIFNLSLKVKESAKSQGNLELAVALEGLSPRAIELLIDAGDKSMKLAGYNYDETKISFNPNAFFGYLELEKAGFLQSAKLFEDLNKWIWDIPGESKILYLNKDGTKSSRPNEAHLSLMEVSHVIDVETLNEKHFDSLNSVSARLNVRGRGTWKSIVSVVAEQLANPSK